MSNSEPSFDPAADPAGASSKVRRLLVPSIAAAGMVFGLSLFLLGTHKVEWFERVARVRAEDNQRDYALTHRGRDTAIRVVGTAIVLSVATGIGTVEVLRKWYAVRDRAESSQAELALPTFLDNPVIAVEDNPMANRLTENSLAENSPTENSPTENSLITKITDAEISVEDAFFAMPVGEQTELEQAAAWEALWQPEVPVLDLEEPLVEPLADRSPTAVHLPYGVYHIDRQVLPGTLHSQLVLHYHERAYRFLRSAQTLESVQAYCAVYLTREVPIVVTPLVEGPDSGYGLWEGL
jgi:hypothetical protein